MTDSKFIAAGGLDIHYLEAGEGPPLVLLHGGLATAAMWTKRIADLAKNYRVYAPDTRGHGQTSNPAAALTYPQLADDVAAFIAALGIERPHIAGYSDGGQTALEFGLRHPGKARSLVLGGAVSEPTPAYLDGLRGWGFPITADADEAALEAAFGAFFSVIKSSHGPAGESAYWRRFLPQISDLWLGLPSYSSRQMAAISEPVLVLMGDRDELGGLDQPIRLYRSIPGAELGVVPGSPHGAAERDVFWTMVRDFHARRANT